MTAKLAFIGLGQMGSAMAQRLATTGIEVRGFDLDPATRERVSKLGIDTVDTIEAAVRDCDTVLTSLPDSAAVRAAWLGRDGITTHARSGSLCVDLSTIDHKTMQEVAAAAVLRGLRVVDCPVSGSPSEALEGKLVLITAGERDVVESAKFLFERLGSNWVYSGAVGSAKIVKIVNNMMSMGNVLVAAEAFAIGQAAGVDPNTLYDILSVSGGRSHHFTKRFPKALKGDFAPGFKLELGEKDLALALQLGRQTGVPTPAASLVREISSIALAEGLRGKDIVALLALYQKWHAK